MNIDLIVFETHFGFADKKSKENNKIIYGPFQKRYGTEIYLKSAMIIKQKSLNLKTTIEDHGKFESIIIIEYK